MAWYSFISMWKARVCSYFVKGESCSLSWNRVALQLAPTRGQVAHFLFLIRDVECLQGQWLREIQ